MKIETTILVETDGDEEKYIIEAENFDDLVCEIQKIEKKIKRQEFNFIRQSEDAVNEENVIDTTDHGAKADYTYQNEKDQNAEDFKITKEEFEVNFL